MATITLKSESTLEIKSIVINGELTDSNGNAIGGRTNFIFIESEVAALETKLNQMGLSLQAIYDAAFGSKDVEE